jgi:hypothetical protein
MVCCLVGCCVVDIGENDVGTFRSKLQGSLESDTAVGCKRCLEPAVSSEVPENQDMRLAERRKRLKPWKRKQPRGSGYEKTRLVARWPLTIQLR